MVQVGRELAGDFFVRRVGVRGDGAVRKAKLAIGLWNLWRE